MRVGFAGTPEFAARALAAIHEHGITIPLVLTRPDRPFGRGLATAPSAVKRYAIDHGVPVWQPQSFAFGSTAAVLEETALDVLVVAAYGLILPPAVLAWPRHGCLNIHASLLPRWRGAAPIARAVEAGDATSGVTIMQMDAGLDTGAIVASRSVAIAARETAGSLHDRLASLGADMIVEALETLARDGRLRSVPQPAEGATYAPKIGRADAVVDWTQDPRTLDRRIRALAPTPGAVAGWQGAPVKLRGAIPLDVAGEQEPGTVVAVGPQGIDVACGADASRGVLRLVEVQPAGGRTMSAKAFAAGRGVAPGRRFEAGR
jgi:methionyl-tRNA formyltransferase